MRLTETHYRVLSLGGITMSLLRRILAKEGLTATTVQVISEKAQRAFDSEILPGLERLIKQRMNRAQAAYSMMDAINTAFSEKNSLYNILIQHQSSFENDAEFKDSLEKMIVDWGTWG